MRIAWIIAVAGCSGRAVPVVPEGLTFDYAFAVVAEEAPISVSEAFSIEGGDLDPIHVKARLDRQNVFLIGLDRRMIAVRGFDPRLGAVRLSIADPPVDPIFDPEARTARLRLPPETRLFALDEDPARFREMEERDLLSLLTLEVPFDPMSCDPGLTIAVFARITSEGNFYFEDFVEVARLSEDRAVGMTPGALYVVDRGAVAGEESALRFEQPIGMSQEATAFALDRGTDPPLAYVGFETKRPPLVEGKISIFEIDGRALRMIETSTYSVAIYGMTVDRAGRAIAVGAEGTVLVRERGSTFVRAPPFDGFNRGQGQRIVATDSPSRPHFAASPNRLHLGDLTAGAGFQQIEIELGVSLDFIDLAVTPGADPDHWSVSKPPRIHHRPSGNDAFREVTVDLPRELLPCAGASEELPTEFASVAAIPEGALTLPACDAMLFVRKDGCGATIRFPERDIRPARDDGAIEVFGDWITVATPGGYIWDVTR